MFVEKWSFTLFFFQNVFVEKLPKIGGFPQAVPIPNPSYKMLKREVLYSNLQGPYISTLDKFSPCFCIVLSHVMQWAYMSFTILYFLNQHFHIILANMNQRVEMIKKNTN